MKFRAHIVATFIAALCTSACGTQAEVQTPVAEEDSLYKRLGGVEVLRRLVDAWMLEVATDPRIRDFFAEADLERVKLRLVERICVLVGGPCLYRGLELRELHAPLGIEPRHMRAFVELLEPAMLRVKVAPAPARELREAMAVLGAQVGTTEPQ